MEEKKDSRRVKLTKKLMSDALIEILEKKPLAKVSVKEICENADVNRSTFYAHYSDQFSLFSEIENEIINKTPAINIKISTDLEKILSEFFEYIEKNKKIYKAIFENSRRNFSKAILNKIFSTDDNWLRYLDASNELHFFMSVNALGGLAVVEKWIYGEIEATPKELANAIILILNKKK